MRCMTTDTAPAIDLSRVLDESHENKWVALSPDYSAVLGVADSLSELMRTVTGEEAIYHRVLPHDVSFAPIA
jgi:hypothetical protein